MLGHWRKEPSEQIDRLKIDRVPVGQRFGIKVTDLGLLARNFGNYTSDIIEAREAKERSAPCTVLEYLQNRIVDLQVKSVRACLTQSEFYIPGHTENATDFMSKRSLESHG